jgi:thiopurine S-methyltransferase
LEHQFWHDKWQQNHIGFDEPLPHRFLTQNIAHLGTPVQTSVFVPLCGKSIDMVWLTQQGFKVVGVELSELAIRGFFTENKLKPKITTQANFKVWHTENITLFQGDFFSLTSKHVKRCTALYDRAALIALPEAMRANYAAHLNAILPSGHQALLISLSYPAHQKAGPPFSVTTTEIERLFENRKLKIMKNEEVIATHPHFAKNGMTSLIETVYCY